LTRHWLLRQYWCTFTYTMSKQAWIQDPKTANTMRFHFDPKSWSAHPMYFVDSGRHWPLPGAAPLLKTRSHMRRNEARELSLRLKAQGWKQVAPQWGAEVASLGVV
jgi:hypothetical protein